MKSWYLDYAAATPVDPRVLRAMRPYFSEKFGNPGSLHRAGAEALKALDGARETLARVTGVEFRDVVFTASATEANNLALRGVIRAFAFEDQNGFSPAEKPSFPSARHVAKRGDRAGTPPGYPRETNARIIPKIIVSAVEHDSVLLTARDMERAGEIELVVIPVDKHGVVDIKKLESALDEKTVLVSVMYVNNEVGTLQPISEIAKIIRDFKARPTPSLGVSPGRRPSLTPRGSIGPRSSFPLFHVDAAQAFLYYSCNVKDLGMDLMTLSSQKIYGPKGAGALCVRTQIANSKEQIARGSGPFAGSPLLLAPLLTGGGQEFGLRAGTENIPAIVGFSAAAEYAEHERKKNVTHAARVRDIFTKEIKKSLRGVEENAAAGLPIGQAGLPANRRAPHIANIAFPPGVSSEDLLVLFDREGIAASPGAACSARALALSHVLRAVVIPDERIRRSIRFSFGRGVTPGAAKEAARRVVKACRYVLGKKS